MKTRRKIIPRSQKKKKIIPLHFQKKRPASLSQILNTAKHQRQVKELMKNNRNLARALEESQCVVASNNVLLQEYTRENNQILLAKMKVNEMAQTIQKLVVDLNDVVKYLDVCHLNSARRPFDGIRMISRQPDLETIDESIVSVENSQGEEFPFLHEEASTHTETPTGLQSLADSSLTEVYNVQQLMTNLSAHNNDSPHFEEIASKSASESLTPPTPELNLPLFVSKVTTGKPENSINAPFEYKAKEMDCFSSPKNTVASSKIPVRRPCLFPETLDRLDSPVSLKQENRRETFVVVKETDNQNIPSTSRRTFTINEIISELSTLNELMESRKFERSGTFIVPDFQKAKPPQSTNVRQQTATDLCPDENTIHINEDMDLTEIIPTSVSAAANSLFNRDTHTYSENSFLPFVNRNKEILKTRLLKPTVKINEQISPIAKVNARSELKKDSEQEKVTNAKNSHLTKTLTLSKGTKETKEFLQPDKSPSKKLSKQQPLELNNLQEVVQKNMPQSSLNSESNLNLAGNKKMIECPTVLLANPPQKNVDTGPNIQQRTSIMPDVSEKNAADILTKLISEDPEQDFIETSRKSIKRVSTRKSLKPNNIQTSELKTSIQNSNSDNNAKDNEKTESLQANTYKFEFSSSESDDETIKKSKLSKNVCKKNSSKFSKLKEKSTVASLERDINLMYQNQSRKKRSMKRRVSFANTNISPDDTDAEHENTSNEIKRCSLNFNQVENDMESPENLICLPENKIPAPRRSILKKSQPPVNEKRCSFASDISQVPLHDVHEPQQDEQLHSINSPDVQENVPEKSTKKSTKLLVENNDLLATDIASQKHSEIFGDKVYQRSESKRTFSGVSERASKKRFTADDDFLDAAELDLSGETENVPIEIKEKINSEEVKDDCNTKTPKQRKKSNKNSASKKSKGKKVSKSKQSTEIEGIVSRGTSISSPLVENKQFCTSPHSKLSTSSTDSSISQKENITVSENGGRSRRVRPQISFKEPCLNRKMRR